MDSARDPNFPVGGLDIRPSHTKYTRQRDGQRGISNKDNKDNKEQDEGAAAEHRIDDPYWLRDSHEDIVTYGIAGRIWEAAYILTAYLTSPRQEGEWVFDPPCSIFESDADRGCICAVELGAGVGLVGIHLARQLAGHSAHLHHVLLTDLDNVVPLMQRNIASARLDTISSTVSVTAHALPWGSRRHANAILSQVTTTTAEAGIRGVTHVICSDLVYFTELLAPLLRSLIDLTSVPERSPDVVIGYKIRSLPKEEPFWRAFGVWFVFEPVRCAQTGKAEATAFREASWERFGSRTAHFWTKGAGERRNRQASDTLADDDVYIFVARRKPSTFALDAPSSDASLMSGMMRPTSAAGDDDLIQGTGMDTFECLRMAECMPFDV